MRVACLFINILYAIICLPACHTHSEHFIIVVLDMQKCQLRVSQNGKMAKLKGEVIERYCMCNVLADGSICTNKLMRFVFARRENVIKLLNAIVDMIMFIVIAATQHIRVDRVAVESYRVSFSVFWRRVGAFLPFFLCNKATIGF